MAEIIQITTSSQIKSADTKSEIANHNGKENRAKYNHKNEDIDTSMSHLNAEFDFYDRDELLEKHYREKIDKHNKNNNSAKRRWDSVDDFLKTFEGKKVKINGQETDNERWATMSQISYFGGKDTLGEVIEELKDLGVDYERICETYAEGYKNYVKAHNERFTTLPIYHSDVHFDETTPHGHDAIVVMGHTAKGNPSDSFNNALGEIYGYPKNFEGKRKNIERYREENDELIFKSIAPKIAKLAKDNGLNIDFEAIRTGEEGSLGMEEFKIVKDLERQEEELKEKRERNAKKNAELKIAERNLKDREKAIADKERAFEEEMNEKRAKFKAEIEAESQQIARLKKEKSDLGYELRVMQERKGFIEGMSDINEPLSVKEMADIISNYTDGKMTVATYNTGDEKPVLALRQNGTLQLSDTKELINHAFDFNHENGTITMIADDAGKVGDIAKVLYDLENRERGRYDTVAINHGIDTIRVVSNGIVTEKARELEKEQERTL